MEAYTSFAYVYDTFMDNVPYGEWARHIREKLCEHGVTDGIVLDLGCGTGTMTERLAGYGYDMIGVDNSEEMLELAMEKKTESGYDILYLLQDMRGFELYGTVRAVVSVCDSVNYITEPDELEEVFRLVNNYLDPKGIFLFDFNTVHKYRDVIGDSTIAEDRGVCSFIWDNRYYEKEQINEQVLMSDLNFLEYVFQKGLQPLNTLLFDEQVFRYHHRHKEYQKFLLQSSHSFYMYSYQIMTVLPFSHYWQSQISLSERNHYYY